jgi:hypothetical protein
VYVARRQGLLDVGCFDATLPSGSDIDLWLRLALAGHRFAAVHEPLAIKHDSGRGQMKTDAVARLIGLRKMEKRWSRLRTACLGRDGERAWFDRRSRRVAYRHERHLDELARGRRRIAALRYALRMLPMASWGSHYIAQAVSIALLGSRRPRMKQEHVGEARYA